MIDLRVINEQYYKPGERIIDDIETLGWLVVWYVRIGHPTREDIKRVSRISRNNMFI